MTWGMKDGYAEFAVGIDVGMVQGPGELEGWRCVRVVAGKCHLGLEIAAVV